MRGLFLYYCPLIWTVKPCNFSGAILQHNCRVCLFTRVWDGVEGLTGDCRSSHLQLYVFLSVPNIRPWLWWNNVDHAKICFPFLHSITAWLCLVVIVHYAKNCFSSLLSIRAWLWRAIVITQGPSSQGSPSTWTGRDLVSFRVSCWKGGKELTTGLTKTGRNFRV